MEFIMIRYLLLFVCLTSNLAAIDAIDPALNAYFDLLNTYPYTVGPHGKWQDGEIEILTNIDEIALAKAKTGRTVGIMAQDNYWIWLNDAVRFPNGTYGVYGRIIWTQSLQGTTGAAVMCVSADQRIFLNCNYRHATRSWELELPRGGCAPGEATIDTARREVKEETGMVVDDVVLLGEIASDSGLSSAVCPIYFAYIIRQETAQQEDSEAIEGIIALSLAEIFEGLKHGQMQVTLNGRTRTVNLRDPFLTYAILQAQLKGLLPKSLFKL